MKHRTLPLALLTATVVSAAARAQNEVPAPPIDVQKQLDELRAQIEKERVDRLAREQALLAEIDAARTRAAATSGEHWYDRFTFGGYGEIHYNNTEGEGGDVLDMSRFVAYIGYRFADWIQLHSEIELEHAFVQADDELDGELLLEQLHVDFTFNDAFHVRAGRFLTPLGIINKTHEPTTFNGVERPLFDSVVLPTTWSADGIGVFGNVSETVRYEAYVQSSLDGSAFDSVEGIREGRIENIASMNEPGLSGRLDWFAAQSESQSLRLGVSAFTGGLDNGNAGEDPGVDGDLQIYSADFQWSIDTIDLRGAYAFEKIGGAAEIGNNVASEIDGYSVEAGWHCLPAKWKDGKLAESDLVLFTRWDDVDTQKDVPTGVIEDPRGKQTELTFGASFFPIANLVLKADYQIRDDDTSEGVPERFNLGIGWTF